jgi:hypothetical protein
MPAINPLAGGLALGDPKFVGAIGVSVGFGWRKAGSPLEDGEAPLELVDLDHPALDQDETAAELVQGGE